MVGPAWCQWWAIFGAFGLTSAVGLDIPSLAAGRPHAQKTVRTEGPTKLDEMIGDMESSGAILAALHQLQLGAADPTPQSTNCQTEPRMPFNRPATVMRLLRYPSGAG